MDDLIRRHLLLLQQYSASQESLNPVASEGFLRLSRCRYHGIKLSSDQFRPELSRCLSVKLNTVKEDEEQQESPLDYTTSQTSEVTGEKAVDTLIAELQEASLSETTNNGLDDGTQNSVHKSSQTIGNPRASLTTTIVLSRSPEKKLDPIRDIDIMPTETLKQTQASFRQLVSLATRIAELSVELHRSTQAIKDLRMSHTEGNLENDANASEDEPSQRKAEGLNS